MEAFRLRVLWGLGQIVADLSKALMLLGHAITRLAHRMHDWADRR
jgi:hypothetical protein